MQRKLLIEYLLVVVAVIPATPQSRLSQPAAQNSIRNSPDQQPADLNAIIDRLEKAQAENRAHYRAYTVTRDYHLFSKGDQMPRSAVVAEVNFVPPDLKSFKIQKVIGSSRGEKIARSLLEHEVQAMKEAKQSSLLDRENYSFTYMGTDTLDGHACYVVGLHPKHKRPNLIAGHAWIDQVAYLPRYAEGDLSKTPSWWLKRVHVKLSFDDLDGMWLETGTQAVAEVRWFGEHTFTSRTVDYRAAGGMPHNLSATTLPKRQNAAARRSRRPVP
jgi:hypothetical protein